jgi:hypothetical protein
MRAIAGAGLVLTFSFFLAVKAESGEVTGPLVVSENWPECTDLNTWVQDVLRIKGLTGATDQEKGLAVYYWNRLFLMGGIAPSEGPYNAETVVLDLHKLLFVYGYGYCSLMATTLEGTWCAYKASNSVGRRISYEDYGHTMAELYWNGSWHAFDTLFGYYFIASDSPSANVLSYAEVAVQDSVLRANEGYTNRCKPFFERPTSFDDADRTNDMPRTIDIGAWRDLPSQHVPGTKDVYPNYSNPNNQTWHNMAFHLPKGIAIERQWDSGTNFYVPKVDAASYYTQGNHYRISTTFYGGNWPSNDPNYVYCQPYLKTVTDSADTYFHNQQVVFFSSGTLNYDADLWTDAYQDAVDGAASIVRSADPPYLRPNGAGTAKSIVFRIRCPYVLADGSVKANIACGPLDTAKLYLSLDGTTWEEIASGGGVKNVSIGKSRFDATHISMTGKYDFRVKFECTAQSNPANVGLCSFHIDAVVQSNLMSLPRIIPGTNTIHFKVADQADVTAPTKVTYQWKQGATPQTNVHTIQPADFSGNTANYSFDATGLTRCDLYRVEYAPNDSDADGLPDTWEILHFGTLANGAAGDNDADNVTNIGEFNKGTDPANPDTDGDGINDDVDPNPLFNDAGTPLTITTSSLPSGTEGVAYSGSLAAAGGTPPYSWSLQASSLPPGLSLTAATGAITGDPTTAGTYNFSVTVTDSVPATATKPLSITIVPGGGTYTFQRGLDGYNGVEDTFVREDNPTSNWGSEIEVMTFSISGADRVTLIKFDLTSIASGSTVDSALLELNLYNVSGTGTIHVAKVNSDWAEAQATWNVRLTGTSWPGGDAIGSSTEITTISQSVAGWVSIDVTTLVQQWVTGTANNYGFCIWADGTIQDRYRSSEYTTAAERPKLTVTVAGGGSDSAPPDVVVSQAVLCGKVSDDKDCPVVVNIGGTEAPVTVAGLKGTWNSDNLTVAGTGTTTFNIVAEDASHNQRTVTLQISLP